MNRFIRWCLLLTALCTFTCASPGAQRAAHVFIISIDGGKPAVIVQSQMPVLGRLVAEGAHTWTANTIYPSSTLPSHTSMLTGVGPEQHKILWNTWIPTNPIVQVPTVFLQAKRAGLSTAMFVGKEKFFHLLQTNALDKFDYNRSASGEVVKSDTGGTIVKKEGTVFANQVARDAAAYIAQHQPNLCFIHFSDPDAAGHTYGWGSPEQIKAFANTDQALEVVLKAIREAGIADDSVVIVSADHGGHAKGHGTRSPDDMLIPWIVWGKNVRKGLAITTPVTTCDTAATALWLLGLPLPAALDGKAVESAFD